MLRRMNKTQRLYVKAKNLTGTEGGSPMSSKMGSDDLSADGEDDDDASLSGAAAVDALLSALRLTDSRLGQLRLKRCSMFCFCLMSL